MTAGVEARPIFNRLRGPSRAALPQFAERFAGSFRSASPALEDYSHRCHDHYEAYNVVPADRLFQVEDGKHGEDHKRDDLLNRLELRSAELVGADAIGGNLKAIFKEGNHPADHDYLKQWHIAKLQVAIPGKGHEDIGNCEQRDGSHG